MKGNIGGKLASGVKLNNNVSRSKAVYWH